MFEKLFASVIIGLMIVSLMLQFTDSPTYAYALLFPVSVLTCWRYLRWALQLHHHLSFLTQKKYTSAHQLISHAGTRIREQEEIAARVIHEIEKTGDDQSADVSMQLDTPARDALVRLREKLASYKKEEATRRWVIEGIALMGSLRKSIDGMEDYARQVISQLIKYVGANQGAFYLVRGKADQQQVLELVASYAYGKQKYNSEKVTVSVGSGMLGQAVESKGIVFVTQVPKDYVRITSGLGEGTPTCILICPLIFDDQVYGALEMASFSVLADHQLDFARQVSANIAVELSAMLIHENTERLLEQTIHAQAQMRTKEHQISRKLLEVEAERSKNSAILNGCMDGVISFDARGIIDFANPAAEEIFNLSSHLLVGSNIRELIELNIVQNRQGENCILSASGNEITIRTEVTGKDHELSLLLTSTKVKVNEGDLFTLFIQKISVDLF